MGKNFAKNILYGLSKNPMEIKGVNKMKTNTKNRSSFNTPNHTNNC